MKLVPKPEGFELRNKRSGKKESCEVWEPKDALYSASALMEGKNVSACVVIWQEIDSDGRRKTVARRAGPAETTAFITMRQAGYYMGWEE